MEQVVLPRFGVEFEKNRRGGNEKMWPEGGKSAIAGYGAMNTMLQGGG